MVRENMKTISVLLIALFLIAVPGSGCLQQAGGENAITVVEPFGPDTGGSLDPAKGWTGWYVGEAGIYETLVAYDEKMVLYPKLAESFRALNETAWEIKIRKGVTFHDGTAVDADAVLFSLNRVLSESNSRSAEYAFIKEIRKTNDSTIVIETHEPYAPLIASLVDPVMSIVSPAITDVDKKPVGTGPFKFVSFETGASLDLVKNEDYWDGDVKVDKVYMKYNTDPASRTLMLKSGDVDIARDILPNEYNTLSADQNINLMSQETLRTYFLYINCDKEPFNDVRVRRALSYALNRQEIVDTALEGVTGTLAVGPFSNKMPWNANDKIEKYDGDPQKALALLAEAGILPGADGKLYRNGKPFTIELQTYTKRAALPASADVIVSQYEAIGIDVTLKYVSGMDAVNTNTYDMMLAAWTTAPTGDPDYFLRSHFHKDGTYASRWTHHSTPETDVLIDEARVTLDPEKRADLYDKIQAEIQKDASLICVFYGVENFAMNKDVRGFVIYPNEYTMMTKNIYKT